jgi:hypothetical protein
MVLNEDVKDQPLLANLVDGTVWDNIIVQLALVNLVSVLVLLPLAVLMSILKNISEESNYLNNHL